VNLEQIRSAVPRVFEAQTKRLKREPYLRHACVR